MKRSSNAAVTRNLIVLTVIVVCLSGLGIIAFQTIVEGRSAAELVPDGSSDIPLDPLIFEVTADGRLISHRKSTPGVTETDIPLIGLPGGPVFDGLDFNPETGMLEGSMEATAASSRAITIDPQSGVVTLGPIFDPFSVGFAGFDIDPATGRHRLVSDAGDNLTLDPEKGTAVANSPLSYMPGDPRWGSPVQVVHIATNVTPEGTTLYGINYLNNDLVRIGGINGVPSPNGGLVTTIGPLGITASSPSGGFDIDHTGKAYATLTVGGITIAYTIDLATGEATAVGPVSGNPSVVGMAVAPEAPAGCSAPSFAPAVNFSTGSSPLSLASDDFNGDGHPDLAVLSNSPPNLAVLLGNGSGGFGTATNFAVANNNPRAVASGDFNQDGKTDLVVALQTANSVGVYLGNGFGGFGAAANFPAGTAPVWVEMGNVNDDGKPDIVTANQNTNSVNVMLGNGSGGFLPPANFAAGSGPRAVVISDFTGDGKPDLVTGNQNSNNISLLSGNGIGGFGPAVNFTAGGGVNHAASADVNGDGKADIITANGSSNTVSVMLNNGSGGFGTTVNFAAGSFARYVGVQDLNDDGKLDLAVANQSSDNISIFLGTGTGNFGPPTAFPAGDGPVWIEFPDLNSDNRSDLAIVNMSGGNVSALLNTCGALASGGCPVTFTNSQPITFRDQNSAVLYPSAVNVSGLTGNIPSTPGGIGVKINDLTHQNPDDVALLLVSPNNTGHLLQIGAGDSTDINNLTYSISDLGATQLPPTGVWGPGPFRPTSHMANFFFFPPAPQTYENPGPAGGGTATLASTFGGQNPNGEWRLFVKDHTFNGQVGQIAGGWDLTLEAGCPAEPAGNLQFGSPAHVAKEGSTATVLVNRVSGTSGPVTVKASIANGTAIGGSTCSGGADFVDPGPQTLTFGDGATSRTVDVQLCFDAEREQNETFAITLSDPTGGTYIGSPGSVTVTIDDIRQPFSGTINVGPGEEFDCLTNDGCLFETMNESGCIAPGPIQLDFYANPSPRVETGRHQLKSSSCIVTFEPVGEAVIFGSAPEAVLWLNGMSNFTIDGLNTGGNSLTILNDNPAGKAVFVEESFHCTFTNLTIESTSPTSSDVVIAILDSGDVEISDCTVSGPEAFSRVLVEIAESEGIDLSGCDLDNIAEMGVSVEGSDDVDIENNKIEYTDPGLVAILTGGASIFFGGGGPPPNQAGTLSKPNANATSRISGNEISGLRASQAVTGILVQGDGETVIVENNEITDFPGGNGNVVGIQFAGSAGMPTTATIRNNFVALSHSVSSGQTVIGILDSGKAGDTFTADHNTVFLGGSAAGNASSWAFLRDLGSPTSHTARNNIAFNNRTGSGNHFATGDQSAGTGTFVSNSNFFVGTGTTAGNHLDLGTNSNGTPVSFAAWQAGLPARDANSTSFQAGALNASNYFVNAAAGDLHILPTAAGVLGQGMTGTGIAADHDSDPRPVTAPPNGPDRGADELVQPVAGVLPGGTYRDATGGTGDSLGGDVVITGTFHLTGAFSGGTVGQRPEAGGSTLTIDCDASITRAGPGAGGPNYFDGRMRKNFCSPGTFTFPVGENGHSPVTANVTTLATSQSQLTVEAFDATLTGFDAAKSVSRYWSVVESGDLSAFLSFMYTDADQNGAEANYRIWRRRPAGTNSNACPLGPCVDPGTNTAGPTAIAATLFSDWTVAEDAAAVASGASVSGRVVSSTGRGVANAAVSIVDPLGVVRKVNTNPLGFYSFSNVGTGETHTVRVTSKRFRFISQDVPVGDDNVTNVDFVGIE